MLCRHAALSPRLCDFRPHARQAARLCAHAAAPAARAGERLRLYPQRPSRSQERRRTAEPLGGRGTHSNPTPRTRPIRRDSADATPRTRHHLAATPSPRPRCATPICACAHHCRLRVPMPPSRSLFAHATSPQLLTALRLGPRAKAFIDLLVLCGRIAEERSRRVSAGLRYRVL